MKKYSVIAAAAAVALTFSIAWAEEPTDPTASSLSGQSGQSSMSTPQAGTQSQSTEKPSSMGSQQVPTYTDSKTFVKQQIRARDIAQGTLRKAEAKAENKELKELVAEGLKECRQSSERLKEIAKDLNIDTSRVDEQAGTDPMAMQLKDAGSRFETLSGKEFDKAFLNTMISLHTLEIPVLRQVENLAPEAKVKEFAQTVLQKTEKHVQKAKDIYLKVTGTAWTASPRDFIPTARYESMLGLGQQSTTRTEGQTRPQSMPETKTERPMDDTPMNE